MEKNSAHLEPEENRQPERDIQSFRQEKVIPVIEEHAVVEKEVVTTGKVHIRKTVTEENVTVTLPILNEAYHIERFPVQGQPLEKPPSPVRYEGDVMIIPVVKEITIVQKRYEVVEEIHITRQVTETPMIQEITLMKEAVHIKRTDNSADK